MAAPGPQGAQGRRWSPCCRRRRAARRPRRGRRGSAARRRRCAVPPSGRRRRPHLRPADPAAGRPRARRGLPRRAGRVQRRARPSVVAVALAALLDRRAGVLARRCCSPAPVLIVAGPGRGAGHRRREVAAGRPAPAGRAPAVELVRVAQRAGRHLRRGGRRAVVRPRRAGHPAAQRVAAARWARRSAAACGARPTGCPRPTWSSCATAPPSTRAAWCRPTCSTTGCCSMDRVILERGRDPRPEQRDPARGDARAARYGRPGVAGDEGRVGARQDPLDRQPDRPVGGAGREAAASTPTCRPPTRTSPATATAPTTSTHYDLDLDYSLAGNQLAATRRHRRGRRRGPRPGASSTSHGLEVTKVTVDGQPRREVRRTAATGWCVTLAAPIAARRSRSASRVEYAGHPEPLIDRHHGDAGWEELDRRRDRRRPAARRADVVPVQRPARRQGDLPRSR